MIASFDDAAMQTVTGLLREVAQREIKPRFGTLASHEIAQKSAVNDLVTTADLETEKALSSALGKLFSEVAENADLKPVEGLASVGAGWGQQVGLGVLPQVAPNWLSYALMRFEINLRASAILGFVGAGGIGYDLKLAMQWGMGRYDEVVAIFALLFVAIVAIDRLSGHARSRLVRG